MNECIELIRDAIWALRLFSQYYRWEKVNEITKKRVINGIEEELVVDDGIRIRIGWDSECCPWRIEDNETLNDAFQELIQKYGGDKFPESIDHVDGLLDTLENELLGYSSEQRMYVIRRIISESRELLLPPDRNSFLYESLCQINAREEFVYNANGTDEKIVIYGSDDTLGVFEAVSIASWLLITVKDILANFGEMCRNFEIPLKDEILKIIKVEERIELIDFTLVGIEENQTNTNAYKTVENKLSDTKLGSPSVRERIMLLKMLICEVYPDFIRLDGTVQMKFFNDLTGIDRNAKRITNGQIQLAFNSLKRIENDSDKEGKNIIEYNNSLDRISDIFKEYGMNALSDKAKRQKKLISGNLGY